MAATFLAGAALVHPSFSGSARGLLFWVKRIQAVRSTPFLVLVTAATILLRVAWSMWVQTKPYSDFAVYHQMALDLSQGRPLLPDKPLGYPLLLAIWYWAGREHWPGYLLNIFFCAGTVLVVYQLSYIVSNSLLTARIAALLMALWPADIFYSSVLGSEAAYAFFLWLACWLFLIALNAVGRSQATRVTLIVISGLVLAFSDTVRPTSLPLAMPVLGLALVFGRDPDKRFRVAAGIGFMILAIAGSLALTRANLHLAPGTASMPSQRWGYIFFIGTNSESWGRYNEEDARLIASLPGDVVEKNVAALRLGLERIRSDPMAFLALLPKKFVVMWGDDTYGVHYSTVNAGRAISTSIVGLLNYASQIFWCLALLLGLIYLVGASPDPSGPQILLLLLVLSTLFFELWEVQPRYHHFLNPVLAIVAAKGLVALIEKTEVG
ncbi:MAG TPA: hypothetical protein DCL15_04290 [Chloroflexi bacterium]|nr:hypothetical protein [Chloroflexota bacterium]HHW85375.1 hypothetical protein [Chloroflexota bacterium]